MIDLTKIDFRSIDVNSKYYDCIVKLRYKILFEPYGRDISYFDADINIDQVSYHVAAIYEDKVIAYCRLTVQHNEAQISRVFVINEFTKKGIGQKLIKAALAIGSDIKINEIYLDSRVEAVDFYKKLGFAINGEEFISQKSGLKLIKMIKVMF